MIFNYAEVLSCSSRPCAPSPALLALLSLFSIENKGDMQSIVTATQEEWLRPEGQERWQILDRHLSPAPRIMPLLKQMGLVQTRHTRKYHYHYALVFGATYQSVKERISFLSKEWQRGVRFDEVILLGSARPKKDSKIWRESCTRKIKGVLDKEQRKAAKSP